jgi:hypothetical protein
MCGLSSCPLLEEIRRKVRPFKATGRNVEGPSPPSVFVGSSGYPKLMIGPLASPDPLPLPERLERSDYLFKRTISDIYSFRSSLVRGKYKLDVKFARSPGFQGSEPLYKVEERLPVRGRKLLSSVQELALSSRSLDTEMKLTRDLRNTVPLSVDAISMPMGPSVDLRSVDIHGNPKVPNPVEKGLSDTDANTSTIIRELDRDGIPIEHLIRLLSVGVMGEGRRRKLVPTRWSITAIDDMLSLMRKDEVLDLPPLDRYLLYSGNHFGNHFLIALFPPPFRFEMLEQWQKGSLWGEGSIAMDHEGPRGRKTYASSITGAYYSARLSVLDHLKSLGRCGGASVIRWITKDYWAPLGVWVIRETVKRILEGTPKEYNDMGSMIEGIGESCMMKGWRKKTVFLSKMVETSLDSFVH